MLPLNLRQDLEENLCVKKSLNVSTVNVILLLRTVRVFLTNPYAGDAVRYPVWTKETNNKKNLHGKEGGKVNNNNKNNKIYYSN